MTDYDSKVEGDTFVVTNHKKRPNEELRLRFSNYSDGKKMEKAISDWAASK